MVGKEVEAIGTVSSLGMHVEERIRPNHLKLALLKPDLMRKTWKYTPEVCGTNT